MLNRVRSLRVKLLLVLIPAVLFALLVSFGYSALSAQTQFDARLAQKKESLQNYPAVLVEPLWNFNTQALSDITHAMMLDTDILHVEIRDEGGHLVHEASSPQFGSVEPALSLEMPLIYSNAHINQRAGTLRVLSGNSSLQEEQANYFEKTLLSFLLIVITLMGAVYIGYSRLLGGPISALMRAINTSKGGLMYARIDHSSQDELGEIVNAFNTMQDKLEHQHNKLKHNEQRLRTLYHTTPSLLFSFDHDGTILDASDYFLEYLGYSRKQIKMLTLQSLISPGHLRDDTPMMINTLWTEGAVNDFPLVITNAQGEHLDVLVDATLSDDELSLGALAVMTDISSLKQAHRELDRQANTDMLSGLPNRNQFQRYLELLMHSRQRHHRPFALLFIDLDRFKSVNDTFGHQVGDDLIRAAAERIHTQLRSCDQVARLGGDEFAVILEEISAPEDAEVIAKRILSKLEDSFQLRDCNIYASASIGIACYPKDGDSPTTLLQNADVAMYRAKEEGRARHAFYAPEHNEHARERAHVESLLRRAIEDNLLELHFQPIVNIGKRRITGAEVLLRLRDGNTLVPPFRFIPLAEETGLIVPIGAWCIEQACARLAQWREQFDPDFYLSVNVSTRQFQSEQLYNTVAAALRDNQVPADSLVIEITESLLLHDNHNNQRVIGALDNLGCRIAIDDFGTGYSALSYLMKFPLDIIKIDRSFIIDCTNDSSGASRGLVKAIIQMSRSLDLKVITEGIETREQMEFLTDQGGNCAQGFYFAKPMTAQDMERNWWTLHEEIGNKCQPLTLQAEERSTRTSASL